MSYVKKSTGGGQLDPPPSSRNRVKVYDIRIGVRSPQFVTKTQFISSRTQTMGKEPRREGLNLIIRPKVLNKCFQLVKKEIKEIKDARKKTDIIPYSRLYSLIFCGQPCIRTT